MANFEFDPQNKVEQLEFRGPSLIEELLSRMQQQQNLAVLEQNPHTPHLPGLDVVNGVALFKRGNEMTQPELAKEKVTSKHTVDKNGIDSTSAEYSNGVKVLVVEGSTKVKPDGTRVQLEPTTVVQWSKPNKAHPTKSGVIVDAKGREIARQNDDGSVTIATDEGFYTQTPYGVTKITAVRDGKTFHVVNTDDPLGDMRPPEVKEDAKARSKRK